MTQQNPLQILQAFSPNSANVIGSAQAGQQMVTQGMNQDLLAQQIQQASMQTDALKQQQNINNTVGRLQELERQIGYGATPEQLAQTLQGYISESQARGGNPVDSMQALQALQQGGVEGLANVLGQAKQVFQSQGLLAPAGGAPRKIQTATNIPGLGSQITYDDGTTQVVELTDEEQALFAEMDESERATALEQKAKLNELELEKLDEAERRKRLQKQRSDISTGIRTGAQNAARQKPKVNQLLTALESLQTGKTAEAKRILGRFIPGIDIADEEAFLAQVQSLVLEQAQNLSGALSDSDIKLLQESVPSLGNTVEGNRAILTNMLRAMDLKIEEGHAFNEFESGGGLPEQFIFEPSGFVDFSVGAATPSQKTTGMTEAEADAILNF